VRPHTGATTTPATATPSTARPTITQNSPLRSTNSLVPSRGSTNQHRHRGLVRIGLLGADVIAGKGLRNHLDEERVGALVGHGHRVAAALPLDRELGGVHLADQGRRGARGVEREGEFTFEWIHRKGRRRS
jgi:hypothetical protein